jgi:hypothetical protein
MNKIKKSTRPVTYNIIPKGMAGASATVVKKDCVFGIRGCSGILNLIKGSNEENIKENKR